MKKISLFLVTLCLANKINCMDLYYDFSDDESSLELVIGSTMDEDHDTKALQEAYEAQQKREQYLQQQARLIEAQIAALKLKKQQEAYRAEQARLIEEQIKTFKLRKQQELESNNILAELATLNAVEITAFDQFGRQYKLNLSGNANKESIMSALANKVGKPVQMLNFVNLAQPNQRFVINFNDNSLLLPNIYTQAPTSHAIDTIFTGLTPKPYIYRSPNA